MTPEEAYHAFAALPPPEEIPVEAIPLVLTRLCSIQTSLTLRLMEAAAHEQPAGSCDQLLTVDEAAARLRVSPDYLYRHSRKLPFALRQGRLLRFSAKGLERYLNHRQGR